MTVPRMIHKMKNVAVMMVVLRRTENLQNIFLTKSTKKREHRKKHWIYGDQKKEAVKNNAKVEVTKEPEDLIREKWRQLRESTGRGEIIR